MTLVSLFPRLRALIAQQRCIAIEAPYDPDAVTDDTRAKALAAFLTEIEMGNLSDIDRQRASDLADFIEKVRPDTPLIRFIRCKLGGAAYG
jgi:hypothetical protein